MLELYVGLYVGLYVDVSVFGPVSIRGVLNYVSCAALS